MMAQCGTPRSDLGLVRGLLDTVDCNVREGVQGGYNAFFGPGSALGSVITLLLTIYVALLGFRLLTGRTDLRVGDLPVIAIKLGAVILLTTSWASYQSLVFALLFDGPAELADRLLGALPMPQATGPQDIFARLQYSFDQLAQSASALAALNDASAQVPGVAGTAVNAGNVVAQAASSTDPASLQAAAPAVPIRTALQGGPAFGVTALWLSAITLLISTLGLLILAKLMLGLLLAIGPLFVGLLLFESTKGFFEGWLRTALGFALVPLATVVFMAGLLAALEPSLQALALARAENRYAVEPILTVLVIVLTFTAVFGSIVGLCTRLVAGFRLPDAPVRDIAPSLPTETDYARQVGANSLDAQASRASRLAVMVSNSAASGAGADRRDARLADAVTGSSIGPNTTFDRRTELTAGSGDIYRQDQALRLGQQGRKRSNPTRPSRHVDQGTSSTFITSGLSATGKAS
jgi:type IV secretion system protein VirB6